ncbi:hypothetical protein ElyMa_005796400 [Elysia marginata]|uniref:Uncharacterized protein n=1 Tax=Elysia marginata TaxID=1093978 RepID=A0AAV4FVF4_9GAST|nr:hypothetical protein ElyMa_005796400 [Elysia marginata]
MDGGTEHFEEVTPDIAEAKRKDQGYDECDVWVEGHEGSRNWKACTKNPGHIGFTPASQFSPDLLPKPYNEDPDVIELVRLQIELTVRLRVHYTSNARPDGYSLSKFKGQHIPHTGSGIVFVAVYKCPPPPPENENYKGCPCQFCDSAEPRAPRKPEWWSIGVRTAKHVSFDTDETKTAIADLDLDFPGQMVSKIQLHGLYSATSHLEGDIARIYFATHDDAIGQRLKMASKRFDDLSASMLMKYRDPERFPMYTIICSHPHGCSKQVSVGPRTGRLIVNYKVENDQPDEEWTEHTYTTPTCEGSSGAPIVLLGREKISGRHWHMISHVHRQALPSGEGHSGMTLECFVNTDLPIDSKAQSRPLPI